MRFAYCRDLITKKSFRIMSIEYFFENEFNSVILRDYGLSKFFEFFSFMIFEFHNSNLNINKNFHEIGITRSRNFAFNILRYFPPHLDMRNFFFLNSIKCISPYSLRGFYLSLGMPLRGQRTHSNNKTMHRFRNSVLSFLPLIPSLNLINIRDFIQRSFSERDSQTNSIIRDLKDQQRKNKNKPKTPLKQQKKKKKLDVWR
jgi:hypothetical protein